MYIFVENKVNEQEQYPFASEDMKKLKDAIRSKYKSKDNITFYKRYGAVCDE